MALTLNDHWLWDHWTCDDGDRYHLFFLRTSRALHDPERRYFRASMGRTVSSDARTWQLLPDALVCSDGPAFDDKAIWTGSTIVKSDGAIRVFYTGISRAKDGLVQRIDWADSTSGVTFERMCDVPLEADSRWYGRRETDVSGAEHQRNLFISRHNRRWHMLITARAKGAEHFGAGITGHAVSDDLDHWQIRSPLSDPSVFGQLEVSQSQGVDDRHLLVFSCGDDMKAEPSPGGVWVAEREGTLGPWNTDGARYVRPEHLYAGRLLQLRDRAWVFTGFEDIVSGEFVGAVPDPLSWAGIELFPRGGRQEAASSIAWMASGRGAVQGRARLQLTVLCQVTVQFTVREAGRPDQRLVRYPQVRVTFDQVACSIPPCDAPS